MLISWGLRATRRWQSIYIYSHTYLYYVNGNLRGLRTTRALASPYFLLIFIVCMLNSGGFELLGRWQSIYIYNRTHLYYVYANLRGLRATRALASLYTDIHIHIVCMLISGGFELLGRWQSIYISATVPPVRHQ